MLVLDTNTLAESDRHEAFQAAVSVNSTVSVATFAPDVPLQARMSVYDLGPAKVFTIESTGTMLTRTRRGAQGMNECPIACALPMRTDNRLLREGGDARVFGPRDLILVDLSAPYAYDWTGAGASFALHVEYDDLGLPMDLVRRAIREPRSSPMYAVVRDHLERVMTCGDDIEAIGVGREVGTSSVELMRALIVSAAGDDRRTREALSATLYLRIQDYVRTHLRESDLDPTRIAAANGLTVSALQGLYTAQGLDLTQHILDERLHGARNDLAATTRPHRTVTDVAHEWGFTSAQAFSREFHRAYGFTPDSWRDATARNRTSSAAGATSRPEAEPADTARTAATAQASPTPARVPLPREAR